MTSGLPLQGRSIVITRPAHQAALITQRLQAAGAHVTGFPLLEIVEPKDQLAYLSHLSKLSQYDYLIFTSPNAVDRALSKLSGKVPVGVKVAAVGKKTAQALSRQNIVVSVVPENTFNSEALLACPELQSAKGQSFAIIRGEGGRDLLRDTLRLRGAQVDYLDVYRRVCPADDLLPIVKLREQGGLDIIVLTSVESLQNLFRLGSGESWLDRATLLVGSERIAEMVRQTSHIGSVLIATDPSDETIYGRLLSWANEKKS